MSDAALAILTNIVLSVVSIVVSYIIHRLIMRSINRFTSTIGKEVKAPKTLSLLIAFLVYGFGIAAILSIWNIDLAPYLAGLGISGVVLGLAFQEPLTNFLSGILVLVTRKVFEGEVVDIDGQTGTVDVLKMNNTLLRTFDGKLVLIPNRKVWSGTVTKFWPTNVRRIELSVTVDYKSDMEKVIELLKRAIEEEPLVVKDESISNSVVFNSFNSNGITYTVMFWTERATYFDSLNALTIRIKRIFDENGIVIPYNMLDVRIRNT
ncbi:MAG TPA: mechanosensitive ion channel family protein [Fervidobacterium sp.]|nr:mechanosensitive ion channel family protein [Fervidobacterium sp.]